MIITITIVTVLTAFALRFLLHSRKTANLAYGLVTLGLFSIGFSLVAGGLFSIGFRLVAGDLFVIGFGLVAGDHRLRSRGLGTPSHADERSTIDRIGDCQPGANRLAPCLQSSRAHP